MSGRVLAIGGSDSSGGSGIQADIKTVTALGGYAATAVAALTARNTRGVFGVVGVDPAFVQEQMRLVLADIGADAVKTGMLHDSAMIDAVCDVLEEDAAGIPLVVDPVIVAQTGDRLIDTDAMATLKRRLVLLADVLTPGLPEAEMLTGMEIRDADGMMHAADMLRTLGPKTVLLRGWRLPVEQAFDLLATDEGEFVIQAPQVDMGRTYGAAGSFAAAVAAGLARKLDLREAVERARDFVAEAARTAPGFGGGIGPLNHANGSSHWHGRSE